MPGPNAAGESGFNEHSAKRVLIIYSDERLLPANVIADEEFRRTFRAALGSGVEFYSEFLNVTRFGGKAQETRMRDFLREKYAARPPDLVITAGRPALSFCLHFRDTLFSDIPILFCGLTGGEMPATLSDPLVVGIPAIPDVTHTADLILRLHPRTREIAVISGVSPSDAVAANTARMNSRRSPDGSSCAG